jgi:hypothetical protein
VAVNKRPSVAGHFDGHGEALKRYMQHRPMQHVQGYTKSHWTLPSGNYSLRIASADTEATANKTTMYYVPTLMAISMEIAMWHYYSHPLMEEVQGFHKSRYTPPSGEHLLR